MAVDNYVLVESDSLVISAVAAIVDNTVMQGGDTGHERRIKRESFPRRTWQLSWQSGDVEKVESLYEVNGRHTGFLILAPRQRDHMASSQSIGTGNGTTTAFQLKITRSTDLRTASKNILHPIRGSVAISVASVGKAEGSDFTVDYSTGIVTFASAPANGAAIIADFRYYTAVRFDSDTLNTTITNVSDQDNVLQELRSATLIELLNE